MALRRSFPVNPLPLEVSFLWRLRIRILLNGSAVLQGMWEEMELTIMGVMLLSFSSIPQGSSLAVKPL